MEHYWKTGADGKPHEISRQEAEEIESRNKAIFEQVENGGDFSRLLDIEILLKMK